MTNIRLPARDARDLLLIAQKNLSVTKAPDTGRHEPALDIDAIYVGLMPQSDQDSDDKTVIDVTEVTEDLDNYGSDIPTTREQRAAVNIYYGIEKNDYTDLIEKEIESVFLSKNWRIVVSEPHVPTVDTGQETKVYQFARNVENDYEKKEV